MIKIRSLLLFILITTLFLIAVACTRAYQLKGTPFEPPTSVPEIELMADDGQFFRLSESDSAITLVYFGYTFCPDVCPLSMVNVKVALTQLEQTDRARVQVLFISVDPERDTPQVLDRFLAAFDPTFIGLTDDASKIQKVLPIFKVFAAKEVVENAKADYLVSHTAKLFLLNANHDILFTYPFDFDPKDLSDDLTYLLHESFP